VKAVDECGEFLLGGSVVGQVIRPHLLNTGVYFS
jgi:hypothetical protein